MSDDTGFMREALALARMGWGFTRPNPMVGAVIVRGGTVIGRGFHRKAGEAHAEINALNDVRRQGLDAAGADMYVTLEPCCSTGRTGPCTDAIIAAGIRRVVVGALDPNPKHNGQGIEALRRAGIEVVTQVENAGCCELNKHFFRWITTGKPFVLLKMAMTLDGKIATASGESRWITGPEARQRVQALRRLADAVMIGAGTLRRDRSALTVREPENWEYQPQRIIVSDTMDEDELADFYPDGRAEVVSLPDAASWQSYLLTLGGREYSFLLIEGGGELAASALQAGVVDMVEFHIAPKLLTGRDCCPVVGGESPLSMAAALPLHRMQVVHYGEDLAVTGYLQGD